MPPITIHGDAMRGSASTIAVVVLALASSLTACADDGTDGSSGAGPTTTMGSTTAGPTTTTTTTTASVEVPETTGPSTTATTAEPAVDQGERLAALPWADPTDAHTDPIAAVEAFIAFFTDRTDPPFGSTDVTIGEFAAGDSRSGEVELTFPETAFSMVENRLIEPRVTVFVRQAGPDDHWWVLGAVSDAIVVDDPAPDAVIGSPFDLAFTNHVISAPNEVELHGPGPDALLFRATGGGGGVFAADDFAYRVDPLSCDDAVDLETLEDGTVMEVPLDVSVCAGLGPAGEDGTLIVFHDKGITTVPLVFADG